MESSATPGEGEWPNNTGHHLQQDGGVDRDPATDMSTLQRAYREKRPDWCNNDEAANRPVEGVVRVPQRPEEEGLNCHQVVQSTSTRERQQTLTHELTGAIANGELQSTMAQAEKTGQLNDQHGFKRGTYTPQTDGIQPVSGPDKGEYGADEFGRFQQTNYAGKPLNLGTIMNTAEHYKTMSDVDMAGVRNANRALRYIFDVVTRDGRFNHKGARIPLPSGMNINNWRALLKGYGDSNVLQYLEFGWPIGIDRRATLFSEGNNHTSATAHPQDITHYIVTELSHQAMLGPFAGPPTNNAHYSPLMTRPKKDSKFRRVIIDLSWPRGFSVNDAISRKEYVDGPLTISLPTHDDMERAIVRAGRGSFMYKTDLARGYRQLRVDPIDWPYLSFGHGENHFMDICPPFGLRSSAMAMQRVSQAIVHVHGRRGYVSRAYIDDFGGVESTQPRAQRALGALQDIMTTLGVEQAEHKICLPSQTMIWLGIFFDTLAMSMEIPKEKLREIMLCLREWDCKLKATRKEIQSLLGLLNFVASVAPPVRLFTNRMLDDLRETGPTGATSLTYQFKKDVQFFLELLPMINGRKIMGKTIVPYQHQVELDACLSGCGAVAGDQFYGTPFPQFVCDAKHSIAHLELLNIVVAIRTWRERWSGWVVQVYCDNLNSVFVIQTGKSRDLFMRECAREIFLLTAASDIELQICHRPGLQMIWADALSREHTQGKYAQFVKEDQHLQAATRIRVPPDHFALRNKL